MWAAAQQRERGAGAAERPPSTACGPALRAAHAPPRAPSSPAATHLRALHRRLRRPHALRVHARVVEGLRVAQRRGVRQAVQPPQHDRHQRARAAVAAPAVDVHLLALQHALHAVLRQPVHGRVRGDVAVDDGQVQEVDLLLRDFGVAGLVGAAEDLLGVLDVRPQPVLRPPRVLGRVDVHLGLQAHERVGAQLQQGG